MGRRFHFASSRSDHYVELSRNPRSFVDAMQYLADQQYTGQILIDLHAGRPRHIAFPAVERVELQPPRLTRPASLPHTSG